MTSDFVFWCQILDFFLDTDPRAYGAKTCLQRLEQGRNSLNQLNQLNRLKMAENSWKALKFWGFLRILGDLNQLRPINQLGFLKNYAPGLFVTVHHFLAKLPCIHVYNIHMCVYLFALKNILWFYQNKSLPYILVIVRNSLAYIFFLSCRSHVSRWRARRLTVFNHFESPTHCYNVPPFFSLLLFSPSFSFLFLPFFHLVCHWIVDGIEMESRCNREFKPWEKLRELADNKHFVTKHGSMSSAHWAPCIQSVWILKINKNQEFKPERNFESLRIINTLSEKIGSTKGQRLKTDLGGNVGASDSGSKWLWIETQIVQFIHIFLEK